MNKEEQDNVFKINMPIITNEELESLDYMIENDIDNIVQQVSKTILKDRDIIFLKKIIDKLQKENEKLRKQVDIEFVEENYIEKSKVISKNKIRDKIKELEEKMNNGECKLALHEFQMEAQIRILKKLLGE